MYGVHFISFFVKCFLGCEISEDENDKAINGDIRNDLDWQMEEECSAAIADKVEEEYGGGGALVKKNALQKRFSQINCQRCGSSDYVTTNWKKLWLLPLTVSRHGEGRLLHQ